METLKYTYASDIPGSDKLINLPEFDFINPFLPISNYSTDIERIGIVFQCFPKDIQSRTVTEYKVMRRKTKTLELYLVLDYDTILSGSETENLAHIKDVFKKGCETFLKPLKGFNYEGFIAAVIG